MIIHYRADTDWQGNNDGFIETCFYSSVALTELWQTPQEHLFHCHFEYTNGEWRYDPDD